MILSKKPAKSEQNRKMVRILPKLVVESGQNDVLLKFDTLNPYKILAESPISHHPININAF